jgi:hypothetical protein
MTYSAIVFLVLFLFIGCDAMDLNGRQDNGGLSTHTAGSTCTIGNDIVVGHQLLQCVDGKLADLYSNSRIPHTRHDLSLAARQTAANSSSNSTSNSTAIQSSLTLDPTVLATGFESDGLSSAEAGQSGSLTSSNNFINFCATLSNVPITNGEQMISGSCNPAPMGVYPSSANMPSAKFVFPTSGAVLVAGTTFNVTLAVKNIVTGSFVNPHSNFHSAPQQLDGSGQIMGHSHVVIDQLSALHQVTPTDPTSFAFFSALNAPAVNGMLTVNVTGGLPAGFYRISSLNTAANHQPVLVPIAQHGALDDAVHFSVTADGKANDASPQAPRPCLMLLFLFMGLVSLSKKL